MGKAQTTIRCRAFVALLPAFVLLLSSCGKPVRDQVAEYTTGKPFLAADTASVSTPRYIAESHKIEILTSESDLRRSWESAVAFCGTIQCEILSSSITARTGGLAPSGDLSLRVSPQDSQKLLAYVEQLGKVTGHTTERRDETTSVVDTEAKIKNLTSFRDNLRGMLARPNATVKDILEIQQQLTDTQSELDSETAQRKVLANETEKIAVEISFLVQNSAPTPRGFGEIWNALRQSGDVLADSTASLVTTIFAVAPWLILIVPGVWLVMKLWAVLRRRRVSEEPKR